MSLKIFAALVMAGLVAQSSAFVIEAFPGSDVDQIHGFSYTGDKNADHDMLKMSSDRGYLSFHRLLNISAWSFLQGNDSSTIIQNTLFPDLYVSYYSVQSRVGNDIRRGSLSGHLYRSTFNFSLVASGNDTQCKLAVKIQPIEKRIWVYVKEVHAPFYMPEVLKDLDTVVLESLTDVWPTKFADAILRDLKDDLDTGALCKQLLAATPEHFPEPDILNIYGN